MSRTVIEFIRKFSELATTKKMLAKINLKDNFAQIICVKKKTKNFPQGSIEEYAK
jgi:hypothetical protein